MADNIYKRAVRRAQKDSREAHVVVSLNKSRQLPWYQNLTRRAMIDYLLDKYPQKFLIVPMSILKNTHKDGIKDSDIQYRAGQILVNQFRYVTPIVDTQFKVQSGHLEYHAWKYLRVSDRIRVQIEGR